MLPAGNILLGSQHLQTAGCDPNPLIHCRVLCAPKDLRNPSDPCFSRGWKDQGAPELVVKL